MGHLRWRRPAAALLLYLAAAMLLFHDAWAAPASVWVGDGGDPPLFMWFLRWVPWAVGQGDNPFVTYHLNAPDGVNLMWNTLMPLAGLLLAPVTLTLGPVVAYNVLVTAAVALSAWCAGLMIRRYVVADAAALVGGLVYGFSPYMLAHARAHPNLLTAFVPPLLFLVLDEILVRQRRPPVRCGVVLGILAAAQLLLSEELLASQMVVAIVSLAILVLLHRRHIDRRRVVHAGRALSVALALSLALSAWPLAVQFLGPLRVRHGVLWPPNVFASDILAFFVPTGAQALRPPGAGEVVSRFTNACCVAEQNSYLGLPFVVLVTVVVAVWWRRPLVRFCGVLLAALVVLSLGPNLHVGGVVTWLPLPFRAVSELPLFGNILAVRLMLYAFLVCALLVALVVDSALAGDRRRRGAVLAAVAVALAPLLPRLPFPSKQAAVPSFFASSVTDRVPAGAVAYVAPFPRDTNTAEPMLWQAVAGMRYRMVGGYALGPDESGGFGFLPEPSELDSLLGRVQQGQDVPELSPAQRRRLVGDLRDRRVRVVMVGPMGHREAAVRLFADLLGSEGREVGGVRLWTLGPVLPR